MHIYKSNEKNSSFINTIRMEQCRACLYTGPNILDIHKTKFDVLYKECTSLEIDVNDDLPHGICLSCYDMLNQFYFFKQMFKHSNTTLKLKYKVNDQIEDIASTVNSKNKSFNDAPNDEIDIEHVKIECQDLEQSDHIEINNISVIKKQLGNGLKTDLSSNDKKLYNCDYCSRGFNRKYEIISHSQIHKDIPDFKCHICDRLFKVKRYLNYHLKRHSSPNKKCNVCNSVFKTNRSLKMHLKSHLPDDEIKVFKCDHCLRVFLRRCFLITHLETHKQFPDIKCNICNKLFKTKQNLTYHLQSHSSVKIMCQFCNKLFKANRSLKMHLKTHHEDKHVFKCDHCSKLYTRRSTLIEHLELHKKAPDLKCHVCKKMFKMTRHFKRHLKTHK